jgi:hypothetical protein
MNGHLAKRLAHAIVLARTEWFTSTSIAPLLEMDEHVAENMINEFRIEGFIDIWNHPKLGVIATFSVWGAWALGIELREYSKRPWLRWEHVKNKQAGAEPYKRKLRPKPDEDPLQSVADTASGPEAQAEEREEDLAREQWNRKTKENRRLRLGPDDVARPVHLIDGPRIEAWTEWKAGPVCPGCHDRILPKDTLCLRCMRWGWDAYFWRGHDSRTVESRAT